MNNKIILPMELINHILSYRPTHPIITNKYHDFYEHTSLLEEIKLYNHYYENCKYPFYEYMLLENDMKHYRKKKIVLIKHSKNDNIKNHIINFTNYSCNCGFMEKWDEKYYKYRRVIE
jgi:hypothetical protein